MYLVFDIGGTHTRIGLSDDGVALKNVEYHDTDTSRAGLDYFVDIVTTVTAKYNVKAICGGLPGQRDTHGRIVGAPNLDGWLGLPFEHKLARATGCPVLIENDAALAGLGEAVNGAGRGHGVVCYMTISTGVNGVRIVDGRIDPSVHGFEIGQQLIMDESGQLKSLEMLTGGAAMTRQRHHLPRDIRAKTVWKQEAKYLSIGIYNTMLHWSPDIFVLGGSMMRDIPLADLQHDLVALPQVFDNLPELKLAELGTDNGLYGALALLRQHQQ